MSTMGEDRSSSGPDDRAPDRPPEPPVRPAVPYRTGPATVVTPTGWPAPPAPAQGSAQPVGYPPTPAPAPVQAAPPVPAPVQAAPTYSPAPGVPPRPAPLPPPRDLRPVAPSGSSYAIPPDAPAPARPAQARPAAAQSQARRFAGAPSSLTLRRVEPWSVFVMSLLLSLFLAVMTVIAALLLYLVLNALGVPETINSTYDDVRAKGALITFGRFMGVASLLAAVNVVFLTAAATLAAVVYNVCATFAGGVDVSFVEGE